MTMREGGREGEEVQDRGEGGREGGGDENNGFALFNRPFTRTKNILSTHPQYNITIIIILLLMEQLFIILSVFIVYKSNQYIRESKQGWGFLLGNRPLYVPIAQLHRLF